MTITYVSTNLPVFTGNEGRNYQNKAKPTASNTFAECYVPIRFTTSGNAVAAADNTALVLTDRTYRVNITCTLPSGTVATFIRFTYPGDTTAASVSNAHIITPLTGLQTFQYDVAPGMTMRLTVGTTVAAGTINVVEFGLRSANQGSLSA